MPRFYFDLREGASLIPDDEGLECDSLEVVEREAVAGAAHIVQNQQPKGSSRTVTVEVRDEHRQQVLAVTVSMHIRRGASPPEPSDGEARLPDAWSA